MKEDFKRLFYWLQGIEAWCLFVVITLSCFGLWLLFVALFFSNFED